MLLAIEVGFKAKSISKDSKNPTMVKVLTHQKHETILDLWHNHTDSIYKPKMDSKANP